jgi:hypothetical protein
MSLNYYINNVGVMLPGLFKIKFVSRFPEERINYRIPRTCRKGLSEAAAVMYSGFNLQAYPAGADT